jgi:rhodanese-related sulfurtransferase
MTVADVRRAVWLLAAATLLAVLVNGVRWDGLEWLGGPEPGLDTRKTTAVAQLSARQMEGYCEHGRAVVVDAREAGAFAAGPVAGAVNIPANHQTELLARIFSLVPADQTVIIYCQDPECGLSRSLAEFLVQNGYSPKRLRLYLPGWDSLRKLPRIPKAGEAVAP